MRLLPGIPVVLLLVVTGIGLFALQSQAFQYGEWGGYGISPYQSHEKAEFSWSRLRYNTRFRGYGGFMATGTAPGPATIPRPTACSFSP